MLTWTAILVSHFIGDFIFQSDWMAINKSKNNWVLTLHVTIYSVCFWFLGPKAVALIFVTHWITDWCTSRLTSALWFIEMKPLYFPLACPPTHLESSPRLVTREAYEAQYGDTFPLQARIKEGRRHWFFVVIGADQLIHYLTLLAIVQWI